MTAKQQGVGMIEVLIAILVFSLGLLALAGLMGKSLKLASNSSQRSSATFYAYDIIECMRVNRTAALAGQYDIAATGNGTAGTLAGDELVAWKNGLARDLPVGNGTIDVDSNGWATIKVTWDDDGDGTLTTFSTSARISP